MLVLFVISYIISMTARMVTHICKQDVARRCQHSPLYVADCGLCLVACLMLFTKLMEVKVCHCCYELPCNEAFQSFGVIMDTFRFFFTLK